MSAEYGKAGGAILIAVSKSGTNAFHGSAYEYNRNQKLDARNFFEDPTQRKNPFTYDEFGGSIRGPIRKNKLVFFTHSQGLHPPWNRAPTTHPPPHSSLPLSQLSAMFTTRVDPCGNRPTPT